MFLSDVVGTFSYKIRYRLFLLEHFFKVKVGVSNPSIDY